MDEIEEDMNRLVKDIEKERSEQSRKEMKEMKDQLEKDAEDNKCISEKEIKDLTAEAEARKEYIQKNRFFSIKYPIVMERRFDELMGTEFWVIYDDTSNIICKSPTEDRGNTAFEALNNLPKLRQIAEYVEGLKNVVTDLELRLANAKDQKIADVSQVVKDYDQLIAMKDVRIDTLEIACRKRAADAEIQEGLFEAECAAHDKLKRYVKNMKSVMMGNIMMMTDILVLFDEEGDTK